MVATIALFVVLNQIKTFQLSDDPSYFIMLFLPKLCTLEGKYYMYKESPLIIWSNIYYYYYYFNGQYNTLMINRPKAFDNVHVQFLSNIDLGNV